MIKVTIEGTAKEIADLIGKQQSCWRVNGYDLGEAMIDIIRKTGTAPPDCKETPEAHRQRPLWR